MIRQTVFTLRPRPRGFHPVTDEIAAALPPLPPTGLLHLFICHTSAGLAINENADPAVRRDLGAIFDRLVRERESYYTHTDEGGGRRHALARQIPAHGPLADDSRRARASRAGNLAGHLSLRVSRPGFRATDRRHSGRGVIHRTFLRRYRSRQGYWRKGGLPANIISCPSAIDR